MVGILLLSSSPLLPQERPRQGGPGLDLVPKGHSRAPAVSASHLRVHTKNGGIAYLLPAMSHTPPRQLFMLRSGTILRPGASSHPDPRSAGTPRSAEPPKGMQLCVATSPSERDAALRWDEVAVRGWTPQQARPHCNAESFRST
ncbi:unnamed protein product [Diplocarpon coronariae]